MSEDRTTAEHHRELAVAANGAAWAILSGPDPALRGEELLDCAHASSYHWTRAAPDGSVQHARAAWLLSRTHAVAGSPDLAERYAHRCSRLTDATDEAADFDRAYAHEALARAHAAAGRLDAAQLELDAARSVRIADDEDRAIFTSDLEGGPWFGLDPNG